MQRSQIGDVERSRDTSWWFISVLEGISIFASRRCRGRRGQGEGGKILGRVLPYCLHLVARHRYKCCGGELVCEHHQNPSPNTPREKMDSKWVSDVPSIRAAAPPCKKSISLHQLYTQVCPLHLAQLTPTPSKPIGWLHSPPPFAYSLPRSISTIAVPAEEASMMRAARIKWASNCLGVEY